MTILGGCYCVKHTVNQIIEEVDGNIIKEWKYGVIVEASCYLLSED